MALFRRTAARPTLGATRARQGRLGWDVLWMLLVGLMLVVIGFFAAWTWQARNPPAQRGNPAAPAEAARNFNAPQPAAATRQNYAAGGPLAPRNHGNPGQPNRSNTAEP